MKLSVHDVSVLRHQQPEVLVIDVRSAQEYADDGHIAGSVNIPLPALLESQQLYAAAPRIVCVCAAGVRSASAAQLLQLQGYAQVDEVAGGYAAWAAAGLP